MIRAFVYSLGGLASARESLRGVDSPLLPSLRRLRKDAERAMELTPPSVMDKRVAPESGDKHDYFSFGPYWWPDPSKPGGLPYIRRDGEVNPESDTGTDDIPFGKLCAAVETLGLAYWFGGDERLAEKVARLVRVWFLDPATRMNPNFQHAQAIPGVSPGRGIGLIEARRLMDVNEGLALLDGSPSWPDADRRAFSDWLETFYRWLTTSQNGRDEGNAENNHGTWYDAQTAHLALMIGRGDEARALLQQGLERRLSKHIEPDGSQPLELARTRSLAYSMFNLEALFTCATIGTHVGLDWWRFESKDGRSLKGALRYLAPYVDPSKAWPKADAAPADRVRLLPLFAQSLAQRDDDEIRALLNTHRATESDARFRLLHTAFR